MLRFLFSAFVALVIVYANKSPSVEHTGWFVKAIGFVIVAFFAGWGIVIGDKIRNLLVPDIVITDGGVTSLVKARLFWSFGLQAIGCVVAALLVGTLYFNLAGPSAETVRQEQAAKNIADARAYKVQWEKEHAGEVATYKQKLAEDEADYNLMHPSAAMRDEFDTLFQNCQIGTAVSAAKEEYSPLQQKTIVIPATENPAKESCTKADAMLEKIRLTGVCVKGGEYNHDRPEWVACEDDRTIAQNR